MIIKVIKNNAVFYVQAERLHIYPEDGKILFLRNFGKELSDYTISQSRRKQ